MIHAARQRADARGEAVLARLIAWLDPRDPWLHLTATDETNDGYFAWHDGRSGLTLCALGRAAAHASAAPRRFDGALNACSRWREARVEASLDGDLDLLDDLPLAVGGLSFSDQAPQRPWSGWPTALLVVPRILVFRDADRCGVILNRQVSPGVATDDVAAEMLGLLSGLQRRPGQTPGPARATRARPAPLSPELTRHLGEPRQAFCDRVARASGAVRDGRFQKVVVARTVDLLAPGNPLCPLHTLHNLRKRHPDAISFAINPGGPGTFVGATPEILIRKRGRFVDTVALAGTTQRGSDQDQDRRLGEALVRSAKDNTEHAAVVTAIRAALRPVCDRLLVQARPRLRRLADVVHLETPINATLSGREHVLRLVERLHPTPAVGGYPRAALDWLAASERLERGFYAAPVGWVGPDTDGVFAVALRSGLIGADRATAFVGAGIVGDSRAPEEWRETEFKLRTFCNALGAPPAPGQQT